MNTGQTLEFDLRCEPRADDPQKVARLVAATGFFRPDEIAIAAELVTERLQRGAASGYEFLFAEQGERLLGYTCFGAIPCTLGSYDLYWISVDPERQRAGIGKLLLERTEDLIRRAQGRKLYIETSSREQYTPTRAFYTRCAYRQEAVLADFYAPGDSKVIFSKSLLR